MWHQAQSTLSRITEMATTRNILMATEEKLAFNAKFEL
jgi:hypothetical protein